jgi:hypothetical protein
LNDADAAGLKLGWSEFARGRHTPGGSRPWFRGTEKELLELVWQAWPRRRPGAGRDDLDQVVVVPVAADRFMGATVRVTEATILHAEFTRRQEHEEGYVRVTGAGEPEPVRHAAVVLYSAAALLANDGARSGDFDWEVVCLLATGVEDEPMHPLTMARNMLAKPGGTPCSYTAEQFAEAVWYWSGRVAVRR